MGDYTGADLTVDTTAATEEQLAAIWDLFVEQCEVLAGDDEEFLTSGTVSGAEFRMGDEIDFALSVREVANVKFTFFTTPKYGDEGTLLKNHPDKEKFFMASCGETGDIIVDNKELVKIVDTAQTLDVVRAFVHDALGRDWD